MVLGKWDRDGLGMPREKSFSWLMTGYGQTNEKVTCERCGYTISREVYMQRYSLPLACPKCRTFMRGFVTKEAERYGST